MPTNVNGEMWFDWGSETTLLIIHTKKSPDSETWTGACHATLEGLNRDPRMGTLVLTDGGGPSAAQRQELAQLTEGRKWRISVVSSASIVRFMVSSIALFNPAIQSFQPPDYRKGLAHLGLEPQELKTVERAIRGLAQRPQADRFAVLNSVASSLK